MSSFLGRGSVSYTHLDVYKRQVVLQAPVGIEVEGKGRCAALVTQPQMIGAVRGGRPAPVTADKPQERIAADIVLIAVGQGVETEPFEEFGMATVRGCFDADEGLAAAGYGNVFVGGDCQTGPATVIRAIAAGKVAARNIDAYLGCSHKLACGVSAPPAPVSYTHLYLCMCPALT